MKHEKTQIINGYRLEMTCGYCPEQYDVFKDGVQVGYLRLRHGEFRADFPDCGGETVFCSDESHGDGQFTDDEREHFLTAAINALDQHGTQKGLIDWLEMTLAEALKPSPYNPREELPDNERQMLLAIHKQQRKE